MQFPKFRNESGSSSQKESGRNLILRGVYSDLINFLKKVHHTLQQRTFFLLLLLFLRSSERNMTLPLTVPLRTLAKYRMYCRDSSEHVIGFQCESERVLVMEELLATGSLL